MLKIRVKFDVKPYLRHVDAFTRKQIPFAASLALNRTARIARDAVKERLGEQFTLRNNRTRTGIQMQASTKHSLVARVGSRDRWMDLQQTGGRKRARRGRSRLIGRPVAVRDPQTKPTPIRTWPRTLLKRRFTFTRPMPTDKNLKGVLGVYRRRSRTDRGKPELLHVLHREVEIKPRLKLDETVREVVAREFERQWVRAIFEASRR